MNWYVIGMILTFVFAAITRGAEFNIPSILWYIVFVTFFLMYQADKRKRKDRE